MKAVLYPPIWPTHHRSMPAMLEGAALDVTEAEPLAPASPLWDLPNVIIMPHVAEGGPSGYSGQKALFGQNLARLLAGHPLLNVCRSTAKM